MEINKINLTLIGFIKTKKLDNYYLMSNGYKICLSPVLDGTGVQYGKNWELSYNDSLSTTHWVTHIDEIFGFIAEDFYGFGKKEIKKEIKTFFND